jgi:hypothetical protein
MARFSTNPHAGGVGRSEHISLESDISESRAKPNTARPLIRFDLNKGGRGVTTRVHILPDHYAAVEVQRSGDSSDVYTIDLRFVEPRPIGIRDVPWRFLYVAIGITLLAILSAALCVALPSVALSIGGVLTPIGLGLLAVTGYILCYQFTTESLLFLSVHGRARVIVIAGRIGTKRRAQACAAALVTHIKLAQKQFKQPRQAYLRDEMREHARLYEQQLYSEQHYSDAKRRILKAHEQTTV